MCRRPSSDDRSNFGQFAVRNKAAHHIVREGCAILSYSPTVGNRRTDPISISAGFLFGQNGRMVGAGSVSPGPYLYPPADMLYTAAVLRHFKPFWNRMMMMMMMMNGCNGLLDEVPSRMVFVISKHFISAFPQRRPSPPPPAHCTTFDSV
uniref:Uncharacterized protein n=1 Tax=Anopheles melas TaxID=34690 RepID=A0A182UDG8_9DIPT